LIFILNLNLFFLRLYHINNLLAKKLSYQNNNQI